MAAADAAASSTAAVPAITAGEWDVKRLGAAEPTLLVLQTTIVPPPESWIRVEVQAGTPGLQGRVTHAAPTDLHHATRADLLRGWPDMHFGMRSRPVEPGPPPARDSDRQGPCGVLGRGRDDGAGAAARPASQVRRPRAIRIAARTSRSKTSATTARSRRAPARCVSIRHSGRSTARCSATHGPRSSRTGTNARSRASATATASGRRRAATCCRSTRGTSRA